MFSSRYCQWIMTLVLLTLMGCTDESGNNQSDMSNSITNNYIEAEKSEEVVVINYVIDLLSNYVEISIAWDDLGDNEEGYFTERV